MIIAIDGTVASGKSCVSALLAKKLGFVYCNTGSIYRAVTLKLLNEKAINSSVAEMVEILHKTKIELKNIDDNLLVYVDDKNVSDYIRSPEVSNVVADIAAIQEIREIVKVIQKDIAKSNNCVVEGRDIGTVVFPNAEYKFFITAPLKIRAERRYKDYLKQGKNIPLEMVIKDIAERDIKDEKREHSPLIQAKDSILINNSGNSPDPVVDKMYNIIKR